MLNTILFIHYCHKSGLKSEFSEKFNFLWNQLDAIVFLLFHSHLWSIGVLSFILGGIQMWTNVIWKYLRFISVNKGWVSRQFLKFLKFWSFFAQNLLHDWRAVTFTVHLGPRYKGQTLSVQCYGFYLHAILLYMCYRVKIYKQDK